MKLNLYSLIIVISAHCSVAFGMEHKASQRITTPEQCQELHQLAKQAYQKADYRAALNNFTRVILNTQDQELLAEALLYKADIFYQAQDFEKALAAAKQAAKFSATKHEALIFIGALYAKEDASKAIKFLTSAYSQDSCLNCCIDIELGKLYLAIANDKKTDIKAFEKAQKIALKYFKQAFGRNITCCPERPAQAKSYIEQLSPEEKKS